MKYWSVNQIMFSLILLTLGITLLLVNIGVISLEIKQLFVVSYPFVLLVIGLILLFNVIKSKSMNHLFLCLFITTFSILLVLERFNFIHFRFLDFWKLWPVLLIYLAIATLFKKQSIKIHMESCDQGDAFHIGEDKKPTVIKIEKGFGEDTKKKLKGLSLGDIRFDSSNWSLEPMELQNSIGDYFIDFSKAYIPEKETPILIRGWIGDVKMLIPDDVPVHIQTKVKVGDIRIFDLKSEDINRNLVYKSPGYDEAARKLNIRIELKIGSIRIDQV